MAKEKRDLTAAEQAEIRHLTGIFSSALPTEARHHGHYETRAGDRFADVRLSAPGGDYRIVGSDWIVVVRNGRVQRFSRAVAPNWGGPHVVAVPT